jgi:cell division protein FtsB
VSTRGKGTKPRRAARTRRRRQRLGARRLVVLFLIVLVALLYAGPLRSYYDKRELVGQERMQVAALRSDRDELKRRLARAQTAEAVERAARRLSYVKTGEHLYIVKGIDRWRRERAHSAR